MRFLFAVCLCLQCAVGLAAQVQVRIGNILELKDGSQLALDLNAPVVFNTFTLDNPPRLVIDFENARLDRSRLPRNRRSIDIHQVRSGPRDKNGLRVVIDMLAPAKNQVTLVNKGGYHLVVDIFRHSKTPARSPLAKQQPRNQAQQKLTPTPAIELIAKSQLPQPPASAPAIAQSPRRKQTLALVEPAPQARQKPPVSEKLNAPPAPAATAAPKPVPETQPKAPPAKLTVRQRDIVIAIDPGHGGKDPGAVGPARTREKQVVLAIAKRLKKLIDKQPGMRAVLTRNRDKYLHLYQRIATARKADADLFISIHADAYPEPDPRGASVYMLSTRGASSAKARWLASKENASDYIGSVKDDAIQQVLMDIIHDGVLSDSRDLAKKVLKRLGRVGKVHKRSVERANFAVLKAPDIPSILIETAFISNPKEEAKLRSPSHQKKLANAVFLGIQDYLRARPGLGKETIQQQLTATDKQHIIQPGETLSEIARKYKVSLSRLASANGISTVQRIPAGMTLTIPSSGS